MTGSLRNTIAVAIAVWLGATPVKQLTGDGRYLVGALLGRFGHAEVPLPGRRPAGGLRPAGAGRAHPPVRRAGLGTIGGSGRCTTCRVVGRLPVDDWPAGRV